MWVFISYARSDRFSDTQKKIKLPNNPIDTVVLSLRGHGYNVWIDDEIPHNGEDWVKHIKRGIRKSGAFLFLTSPNSLNSPNCQDELEWATKYRKPLIPILLDNTSPEELPSELQKPNALRLSKDKHETITQMTKLHNGLRSIARKRMMWRVLFAIVFFLLIIGSVIALIPIIEDILRDDPVLSVAFLVDSSSAMARHVDDDETLSTLYELARESITRIMSEADIDASETWFDLRLAGGDTGNLCEQTASVSSGINISSEELVRPMFIEVPQGNHAYEVGIEAVFNDLLSGTSERSEHRTLFMFLASDSLAPCGEGGSLLDIMNIVFDNAEYNNINTSVCIYFLDNESAVETMIRLLENSDNADIIDCVSSVDDVGEIVESAVSLIEETYAETQQSQTDGTPSIIEEADSEITSEATVEIIDITDSSTVTFTITRTPIVAVTDTPTPSLTNITTATLPNTPTLADTGTPTPIPTLIVTVASVPIPTFTLITPPTSASVEPNPTIPSVTPMPTRTSVSVSCQITPDPTDDEEFNVVLRTGPGREYLQAGLLRFNTYLIVDAQTDSLAGEQWWRVEEEQLWAYSGVISTSGDCDAIEFINFDPSVTPEPQDNDDNNGECILTVITSRGVNLRTGPGTNYPAPSGLPEGNRARIVGQALGWWRLTNSYWVIQDDTLISLDGDCGTIPTVLQIPPTPRPSRSPTNTPRPGEPPPLPNTTPIPPSVSIEVREVFPYQEDFGCTASLTVTVSGADATGNFCVANDDVNDCGYATKTLNIGIHLDQQVTFGGEDQNHTVWFMFNGIGYSNTAGGVCN